MGGDGGVIASDRRYMRGAGQADNTGDSKRASKAAIAEAEREAQQQAMTTCAITGGELDYKNVVVCPFGRLYNREAAVEALLRRKTKTKNNATDRGNEDALVEELGWQVRGLKDLYPARFQLLKKVSNGIVTHVPICPITSVELNGIQPAYLIVREKYNKKRGRRNDDDDHDDDVRETIPNVLSEKAIKEMGIDALQEEYGPFQQNDMIRLVPSAITLSEIKDKFKAKWESEKTSK
eukprot:CAMPEP_0176499520 /NCGR_PEP_ID=MMETSP0200_2-20121128/12973_1 /TAXON_ID=947934 /ORGANISM="Chaetoceros sp., Strain GSL56" /LENGTH=235 /DNA_ID=CAMNT_0017897949 /DNA_START=103 /DNA_END=807 /DNA_ORIENTATION=+